MQTIQTDWEGCYLDGRTAARQNALIRLMRLGLQIRPEKGDLLWWPYEEIRQTQGFYSGEQVRLERGGEIAEAIILQDASFLTNLRRMDSRMARRFHDPARRRMRVKLTVITALAVIAITAVLYLWGIPAMATLVASRVPVSWEARLGLAIVEHLAPPAIQCVDPSRTRIIDDIVKALTAPLPAMPYTIRVTVIDNPGVNALAAPGGYIVLFRGLINQSKSAEELAGVLAHELQHILQRHSTRALIHYMSTDILFAALTGDMSGATAYGLEGARAFGILHYSRRNEKEADTKGMEMLFKAGIDAKGMMAFFKLMTEKGREESAFARYLSTHPSSKDRVESLKLLAEQSDRQTIKLLPDYDWHDIRKLCQTATQK
jgi:predicted Zn-dependent protease